MQKTCFVIQPFDKGRYDKRYTDTFEPAIHEAGISPYRIDKDPSVQIPIDDIEQKIRDADICLAEITEDNANVWYELGFAMACGKPVILVCAKDRVKFPFDVQHRTIVHYDTESESDFSKLKQQITNKLTHVLRREENTKKLQIESVTKPRAGLKDYEIATLASIAAEIDGLDDGISVSILKDRLGKAGFNGLACNLAIQKLLSNNFISQKIVTGWNGNDTWEAYAPTPEGWDWISSNTSSIDLKTHKTLNSSDIDDEIPF